MLKLISHLPLLHSEPPPPQTPNPPSLKFINRRFVLSLLSSSTLLFSSQNIASNARGLFLMPPVRLVNRYYLVRAGESEYETLGVINTNPVAKTSVDNGLSTIGKKQTLKTAIALKEIGACEFGCWIWPSITQRAYQTAEIIASINNVNRSYIVPEFSFLDARGLGAYEGKPLESVSDVSSFIKITDPFGLFDHFQIYALDELSTKSKPPANFDGTPNESVTDVFVRVTQLMSILETQYSGETVIVVSPDSDNLSVLQAGLIGLDLRRHKELYFSPGEMRFVDMDTILASK